MRLNRALFPLWIAVLFLATACGKDETENPQNNVVIDFSFRVTIAPEDFAPMGLEALPIGTTGNPDWNPPGTVQLYTPPDSLGWGNHEGSDAFGFNVELANFDDVTLCNVKIVVDEINPSEGRQFVADDRGTDYDAQIEGAGVWSYGDVDPGRENAVTRRWGILLPNQAAFTIQGRVLADPSDCGHGLPDWEVGDGG